MKHYIRLDGIFVIKTFSTAFEQPQDGDVCVNENGSRHFNLNVFDSRGLPKLKYIDGEILETNEVDLVGKIEELEASLPNSNVTDKEMLEIALERISVLEDLING
jgi:hypothetical protein